MDLDPVIHQATRLRIMSTLYRNRDVSFTQLRDALALTDGNLGSHAQKLEDSGYLASRRALAGVSFEVRYRITPAGSEAFRRYLAQLRDILEAAVPPNPDASATVRPPASVKAETP